MTSDGAPAVRLMRGCSDSSGRRRQRWTHRTASAGTLSFLTLLSPSSPSPSLPLPRSVDAARCDDSSCSARRCSDEASQTASARRTLTEQQSRAEDRRGGGGQWRRTECALHEVWSGSRSPLIEEGGGLRTDLMAVKGCALSSSLLAQLSLELLHPPRARPHARLVHPHLRSLLFDHRLHLL